MIIPFDPWTLDCDVEATRDVYKTIPSSDPATCRCLFCKNFLAVMHSYYPKPFIDLLSNLGIDPEKVAEVSDAVSGPGSHLYQGFYFFVGSVSPDIGYNEAANTSSSSGRISFTYFPMNGGSHAPSAFKGHSCSSVEFYFESHWAIAEDEPAS